MIEIWKPFSWELAEAKKARSRWALLNTAAPETEQRPSEGPASRGSPKTAVPVLGTSAAWGQGCLLDEVQVLGSNNRP